MMSTTHRAKRAASTRSKPKVVEIRDTDADEEPVLLEKETLSVYDDEPQTRGTAPVETAADAPASAPETPPETDVTEAVAEAVTAERPMRTMSSSGQTTTHAVESRRRSTTSDRHRVRGVNGGAVQENGYTQDYL